MTVELLFFCRAGKKALDHMRDEEMGGDMMLIEQEEEDFDAAYEDELTDDEDDNEKLHYPKQIYDRVHDVSPLIIRLGLDEYAPIFEDQQINFDSFLTLEVCCLGCYRSAMLHIGFRV